MSRKPIDTPAALASWRARHGLTQRQLADHLNTHRTTVARWEIGLSPMPGHLDLALQRLEETLAEAADS